MTIAARLANEVLTTIDVELTSAIDATRSTIRGHVAPDPQFKDAVRAAHQRAKTFAALRDVLTGHATRVGTLGGEFGPNRFTMEALAIEVHNATNH